MDWDKFIRFFFSVNNLIKEKSVRCVTAGMSALDTSFLARAEKNIDLLFSDFSLIDMQVIIDDFPLTQPSVKRCSSWTCTIYNVKNPIK